MNNAVINNEVITNMFPKRRKLRLRNFNYSSPHAYFITICTRNKECLFGHTENETMILNKYGEIVKKSWKDFQNHYPGINDEVYIMMPNHVHGIIVIHEEKRRAGSKPAPTNPRTLSEIIRAFKTYSSRGINELRRSAGTIVWHRGFYEHVIRTEKEYREIGEYIIYNPNKCESDSENADSTIGDF